MRVFVLDKNKKPLMPCSSPRARLLLAKGKAAVFRRYPFAIILLERTSGDVQNTELKLDPGSKTTGIALVGIFQNNKKILWAAHLNHRGEAVHQALESRRAIRRGRRFRKTRYRAPRFNHRTRPRGSLPPSLQSRVNNILHISLKLCRFVPISAIVVETVKFDMQKMHHPEISGIDYQQGTLFGYHVREYLLEKWRRRCAYCEATHVRLEIDHILPRSLGGTDRVNNLAIACRSCNEKKGKQPIQTFLKCQQKVSQILAASTKTLKDASAVNASRMAILQRLASLNKPVTSYSGAQTKYNRCTQGLPKEHWIDALCIGDTGIGVEIPKNMPILEITSMGRGSRQQCRVDRFGFPRTSAKAQKRVQGFQTGDLIQASVSKGKKQGQYLGRVAVRSTGNFNIKTAKGTVEGIHSKYCRLLQRSDGYMYNILKQKERDFLLAINGQVSIPSN